MKKKKFYLKHIFITSTIFFHILDIREYFSGKNYTIFDQYLRQRKSPYFPAESLAKPSLILYLRASYSLLRKDISYYYCLITSKKYLHRNKNTLLISTYSALCRK